jgi:hypothetical protein
MVLAMEQGGGGEGGGPSGPGAAGDDGHNPGKKKDDEGERKAKVLEMVMEWLEEDARLTGIRQGMPGGIDLLGD